ncbi:MAG: hypothetical protein DCF19_21915 [Pseudanabaena frigida]|uniref:Pentapeptide repeat-containing protein n=1 Tax=Pseudanabaena frigida TaxID=945775 RepID=A0A2W4VYG4_9CYAN|nr:MAG: hypothetical protein DCF19_21915 [Pseudanabaena frigida]
MASNRNSPQKGQGANEPDRKKSVESDAADVDWMIISDISTRIGVSSQPSQQSNQDANKSSSPKSSQASDRQSVDDDLEDIEWLRSLGLDEEIERSPSQKDTSSNQDSNVGNIDWLIVTDLKTRMDDPEAKANTPVQSISSQPSEQSDALAENIFDDDLGLDGLDFLESSDFAELNSLNFDSVVDLSGNELQGEIDITEGKIRELSDFFGDRVESSDVQSDEDAQNDDWENILGISENINEQPSLGTSDDSFEMSEQTIQDLDLIGASEDYFEYVDPISEQLPSDPIYQEDFLLADDLGVTSGQISSDAVYQENLLTDDLGVSSDALYQEDLLTDDLGALSDPIYQEDLLVDDLGIADELHDDELIEGFAVNEYAETLQDSQDVFSSEEISDLAAEIGNELDDGFGEVQVLESSVSSEIGDEVWESSSPNLNLEAVNASNEDSVFANDWGQISGDIGSAIGDAVWDSPAGNDFEAVSSTSIDNAFGSLADWEIEPQAEQFSEDSMDSNFPAQASIEQSFHMGVNADDANQTFEQIGNELESESTNDVNWSADLEAEIGTGSTDDAYWNADSDLEVSIGVDAEVSDDENWSADLEAEISAGSTDDAYWNADSEVGIESNADADWSVELAEEIGADAEISDDVNWSANLEAEIGNNIDSEWHQELTDTEDYLEVPEVTDRDLSGLAESNFQDEYLSENVNFSDDIANSDWAIADSLVDGIGNSDVNFDDVQTYDDFADMPENLSGFQAIEQDRFDELDERVDLDERVELTDSYIASSHLEEDSFYSSESSSEISSDRSSGWDDFNDSVDEEMSDDEFDQAFAKYGVAPVTTTLESQTAPNWSENASESPAVDTFSGLDSIIDEGFDLASFDKDNFSEEIPFVDSNSTSIATALTPNRPISVPVPEASLISDSLPPPLIPPTGDRFEEALANDLLNDIYPLEEDFIEEALANDLLNGNASESYGLDNQIPEQKVNPPTPQNLASSSSFDMDTSDRDFLDDFDLDVLDSQITGDEFDSGFAPSAISTGLTPPSPPIAPLVTNPEITSPTINSPPPPPFLPPLPPKRNPNQPKAAPSPTVPNMTPQSKNRMAEDDFDSFHIHQEQNRQRKSINSIDEGWSELLDADTVLSGVLKPQTSSPYSDTSSARSQNLAANMGGTSAGKSSGRERPPSVNSAKRKEPALHDFNELGLEIHDDNTDWSGLLDSGDLSDSITSISTQMPSRVRSQPLASRSDSTSVSETKEIPRDRRKQMASFGDATQARMSGTPNQIDFNRFTEDSYNSSYGYEPASPEVAPTPPSKPKRTMPSVSLETLWQDYLKIPAIGLGAIGGLFLLYSLLNRPIFDLGLRWGVFKDASGKDFTNADFRGAKLDNVDFSKATLTGAKMQDASLVGANFQSANLDGVNFTKANLNRARLIQASVIWAEFNNAQMNLVDFAGADLTRSNFVSAKMEGANLKDAKIGAQGTEKATRFSSTTLLAWQIVNESREGRNLAEQDLSGLNLSFTSLKRANLSNAKLNYTDLTGTDLSGANLTGGQINGANLSGAKLNGINFSGVVFDKTKLPKTDEETVCPNGKKGPCKF